MSPVPPVPWRAWRVEPDPMQLLKAADDSKRVLRQWLATLAAIARRQARRRGFEGPWMDVTRVGGYRGSVDPLSSLMRRRASDPGPYGASPSGIKGLVQQLRRLAVGAAVLSSIAVATAVGTMAYGFWTTSSETYWRDRVTRMRATAVFDGDGVFLGYSLPPGLPRDVAREYATLAVEGPLPPTWQKVALRLEDRSFLDRHTPCGIDWTAVIFRPLITGGVAGGSGVALQTVKALHSPERDNEPVPGRAGRIGRKLMDVGAACSLYGSLGRSGGDTREVLLRLWGENVPVVAAGGTLRGITAAAWSLFGVPPESLSDAQAALLAASFKRPLRADRSGDDHRVPCSAVYPKTSPGYDPVVAEKAPARQTWCRALARARMALTAVMSGEQLDVALTELSRIEVTGVDVRNGLEVNPDPMRNPVSRADVLLAGGGGEAVKRELRATQERRGQPAPPSVQVKLRAREQLQMRASIAEALSRPGPNAVLCIPFSQVKPPAITRPANCPAHESAGGEAIYLTARIGPDGGVRAIQSNWPQLMNRPMQIGSLSKLAAILALSKAGLPLSTAACPRAATEGGRVLRRSSENASTGLTHQQCRDSRNLLTLSEMIAKSDNLALFDALQAHLTEDQIAAAVRELGWQTMPGEGVAYQVAFGALRATPAEVLSAMAALGAAAYGNQRRAGVRFHAVSAINGEVLETDRPAIRVAVSDEAREVLRALLEAPLAPGGTLAFIDKARTGITAGKTGTTLSEVRVGEARAINAKLAVAYSSQRGDTSLAIVTAPSTAVALAPPRMPTARLKPIYEAAFSGP